MVPADPDRSAQKTKLGRARVAAGMTQAELARITGLSKRTIGALERGELENPGIRYLANCAIALRLPLAELLEDEWIGWTAFRAEAAQPPRSG